MTDRVQERIQQGSGRSAALWAGIWLITTTVKVAILLSLRHLDAPSAVKGRAAAVAQAAATVGLLRWLGPVPAGSWSPLQRRDAGRWGAC